MRRPIGSLVFFIVLATIAHQPAALAAQTTVAESGDASISRDESVGTWTLASGGASLTLALDPSRDFGIVRFLTPSGANLVFASTPDSVVQIGGQTLGFGSRAAGFAYRGASASAIEGKLELDATFDYPPAGLQVTRHYAFVSGSPTFEAWTTYSSTTATPSIADLNALSISIPFGKARWVSGLQGDSADVHSDGAFTRS